METLAIEVDQLSKTFRGGLLGGRSVEALRGVSFGVSRGTIFGLLGPNGAGKTTLIKVLLGLVRKSAGRAALLGRPAGDRSGRRRVGYLPESHRIPRHLTGNSALSYYGGLSGLAPSKVRRMRPELLERVGLTSWGRVSVRKYSKGMLQRLGLAQAMLHDPDLLILDEPTDGVDPVGRREMRGILQSLKDEGKTIFINSHLLQEVELVCDHVAILVDGAVRREGSIHDITTRVRPDVVVTVRGDESAATALCNEMGGTTWSQAEDSVASFVLPSPDQDHVNRCIDQLRSRGLDIVSVIPRRDSLEDVFLSVVTGAVPEYATLVE